MTFKNILPIENYVLTTRLTCDEVLKKISDNLEEKKSFKFFSNSYYKPYSGEISGTTFKMSRNIDYRNSFLPVIIGEIETSTNETIVKIKMRPQLFVLITMSLWLGIAGIICIAIIIASIVQFRQIIQNGISPVILSPFGLFLFGSLLTHFAFKGESKISKTFLNKLLESIEK